MQNADVTLIIFPGKFINLSFLLDYSENGIYTGPRRVHDSSGPNNGTRTEIEETPC